MSTIEVHIEIPYKSYVKYEFENNKLMVDRVLATAMRILVIMVMFQIHLLTMEIQLMF